MSIVSLFQEVGSNKLNYLQLLKIKTTRNNFFTKRGACFCQALHFYLEKIGLFLQTSFSIFKDPLKNFWQNRSILLAVHCGRQAFHRTFSLISTILFFPLVMIAGLFQPHIYQRMQDHLAKSFPSQTKFFSLHQEKIEQFYTRSSFERGEIVKILSHLTEKQLEEIYSCVKSAPKGKVDGVLNMIAWSPAKDLKHIEKVITMYDKSSFTPEDMLKILSNAPKRPEDVDVCIRYIRNREAESEDLKNIETMACIYGKIYKNPSFTEDVLKSLSNLTERQLKEFNTAIERASEEKISTTLTYLQTANLEDLKRITSLCIYQYAPPSFSLEDVLKILSKLTEGQLDDMYLPVSYYTPEVKIDGLLHMISSSSSEDLEHIGEIAWIYREIYKNPSFTEDVLKSLSKLTEKQLKEFSAAMEYASEEKISTILMYLQTVDLKDLKRITSLCIYRYASPSFSLEEVLRILSKLTEKQLEEVYPHVKSMQEEGVDKGLNIIACSSPKDLQHIGKIIRIYNKSSFAPEDVLKILSKLTEKQLEEVYLAMRFTLEQDKIDTVLTYIQDTGLNDLKNIKETFFIYDNVSSFFSLKDVLETLLKLTEKQLKGVYSCIECSSEDKVNWILVVIKKISPEGLKQIEKIVRIYQNSSCKAETVEILETLSNLTEDALNDVVSCVDLFLKSFSKIDNFLIFINDNREEISKNSQFLKNMQMAAKIYKNCWNCDLEQVAYATSFLSEDQAEQVYGWTKAGLRFFEALKKVVGQSIETFVNPALDRGVSFPRFVGKENANKNFYRQIFFAN